jgi:T5SS/PEP-CTERM-associated repeat protein
MSSNALPPGVSQELFNTLPATARYFDAAGQAGNWSDPNNWWNGLPGAESAVLVPCSATLNGDFAAKLVMLLGNATVTLNGTLATTTHFSEGLIVDDGASAIVTPAAVLNDAGALTVGNAGAGTLAALASAPAQAALTTVDTVIGRLAGSAGVVTIAGAHWTNTAAMMVGEYGQGALAITNNGVLTVGNDLAIAGFQGSAGQVTVANGGTLAACATLFVGSDDAGTGGAGTLTIGANGLVTVGAELQVAGSGETLVMAGGTLQGGAYAGGVYVDTGALVSGFGTIATPSGAIYDRGTIVATGGTLLLGGALDGAGGGVLDIAAGATADIAGPQIGNVNLDFTGASGVLDLAQGVTSSARIAGFATGDKIEMAGVTSLSFNAATDVLTLIRGNTILSKLHFAGVYASNAFSLTQAGGQALITLATGPNQTPAPPLHLIAPPPGAPVRGLPPGVPQALYAALPASTIYFDGQGQAGNWSNPANWWNGPPGADASVVVPLSTTLNGSFAAQTVMLLGTETVTVNGALTTHSPDLCESFMVCDGAIATFNPGSALNDAGCLIAGNDSDGTLTALASGSARASLTSVDAKIGRLDGGVGVVDIAGGQWTNIDGMTVGENGQGVLAITDGGVVSVGTELIIGANEGSSGQVTVAGGGTLAIGATLDLGLGAPGDQGAATLTIGPGGLVTVGTELNVSAGETLTMAGGTLQGGADAGGMLVEAGGMLSGFGTIAAPAGQIAIAGTIVATGGTLVLSGAIAGSTGALDIASGATADITGADIGHVTLAFTGAGGVLDLATGVTDLGKIADFAAGDVIQMAGVTGLSFDATTDVLTLKNGAGTVDKLDFTGAYSSSAFTLTQSNAGALITLLPGH